MTSSRPVPMPDIETAQYWTAARAHELQIQRCTSCKSYVFPPAPRCQMCRSDALAWTKMSGRGAIRSFTIMRDTFMKGFDPPYVVAQVELEEQPGLVVISNIVECDVNDVAIGLPVEVTFEQRTEDVTLPQFRLRRGV